MIQGIGVDIVEMDRIESIIDRQSSFIRRVLTPAEQQQFDSLGEKRQVEYLAGRFACKEAFSKAYGTGIGKITFQDIEVLSQENGAPKVTKSPFEGTAFVSISHTDTIAMAEIILAIQ